MEKQKIWSHPVTEKCSCKGKSMYFSLLNLRSALFARGVYVKYRHYYLSCSVKEHPVMVFYG